MPQSAREVDVFKKYSKNNKFKVAIITTIIVVFVVTALYFFIKAVVPYTVTFVTNGGTEVPPKQYGFLQSVDEPEINVKKSGYYIEKWSTKKDLSDRFEWGTKIWHSMSLYVDWQPGVAVVLNFGEGEENEDLSTKDLKLIYEQYVKAGSDWTLPEVYNLNENSYHYGERLLWYRDKNCTGDPIDDETFLNITEDINLYGKWFDVKKEKFRVDENGVLQKYLGYALNVILPDNVRATKDVDPVKHGGGTDQVNEQNGPYASIFTNVFKRIERVYLNKSLQRVGDSTFKGCESLNYVKFLGGNVTAIGCNAFEGTAIQEIKIPSLVTEIEKNTFQSAKSLKSIELGPAISFIDEKAFIDCYNLKTVKVSSAPIIKDLAFSACVGLQKFIINYEESLVEIDLDRVGENATENEIKNVNIFFGSVSSAINKLYIYVPENLLEDYKVAYGWSVYADYILPI